MNAPVQVALAKCPNYNADNIEKQLPLILESAKITVSRGSHILLKPNLLMKVPLACTNPELVSALASWLLELGAKVTVADSPGFGNINAIAEAIGLSEKLKGMDLQLQPLKGLHKLALNIEGRGLSLPVSPMIFEFDQIFSVCRVKAHSQMRLTLCVKNCFGLIPGLHKAFVHARYGDSVEFFASCIAALYKKLPPVIGVADGVIAMHVTGPSKGSPYPLGLLGASSDPALLDLAIMKILKASPEDIPLAAALEKIDGNSSKDCIYPLEKPEAFDASGFILPANLKPASFNPWHLAKSCVKRIWTGMKAW